MPQLRGPPAPDVVCQTRRPPPQEPSGADATAGKLAVGTGIVTKGMTLLREGELTLDFQAAA